MADSLLDLYKRRALRPAETGLEGRPSAPAPGPYASLESIFSPESLSVGVGGFFGGLADTLSNSAKELGAALQGRPGPIPESIRSANPLVFGDKKDYKELTVKDRLALGLDAASLGLGQAMEERFAKRQLARAPQALTLDDKVLDAGLAVAEGAVMDGLGGQALKNIFTGRRPIGYDTAGQEIYENYKPGEAMTDVLGFVAQGVGLAGAGLSHGLRRPASSYLPHKQYKVGKMRGEMLGQAAAEAAPAELPTISKQPGDLAIDLISDSAGDVPMGEVWKPKQAKDFTTSGITRSGLDISEFNAAQMMELPEFQAVRHQIIQTDIFDKVYEGLTAKPDANVPATELIAQAIDAGAFEQMTDLADQISIKYGIDPGEVGPKVAEAFRATASQSGKYLQTLASFADEVEFHLRERAAAGDETAITRLAELRKKANGETPATGVARWIRIFEKLKLGMQVGTQLGAMRDLTTGGLTNSTGLIDSIVNGIANTAYDALAVGLDKASRSALLKSMGVEVEGIPGAKFRPYNESWSDFTANVSVLKDMITAPGPTLDYTIQLMDQMPRVRDYLFNSYAFEANKAGQLGITRSIVNAPKDFARGIVDATKQFGKALRQGGPQIETALDASISAVNYFRHQAQIRQAAWFFDQRLDAELRAEFGHGIKHGMKESPIGPRTSWLLEEISKPTRDPRIDSAISRAFEFASKQTFTEEASTFGYTKQILDTMNRVPGLKTISVGYPRFLANLLRYQFEHSPHNIMDLFSTDVHEHLKGLYTEGKAPGREALRKISRGFGGLANLSMAYGVRSDPSLAGPKWNLIRTGEKDSEGNDVYLDIAPYGVYSPYYILMEGLVAHQQNRPSGVNAQDIFQAITGMRRASEVPIAGFDTMLEAMGSDNPDVAEGAWKTPVGQIIAGMFVPANALDEIYGGTKELITGVPSSNTAKLDVKGNELIGPSIAMMPHGVNASLPDKYALPVRYSPFTGKEMHSYAPLSRQLTGVTLQSRVPLQDTFDTLGLRPGEAFGSYETAEGTDLVYKHTGQLLADEKLGDTIADIIKEITLPPDVKRRILLSMIKPVKEVGLLLAIGERPDLFSQQLIKDALPDLLKGPTGTSLLSDVITEMRKELEKPDGQK